MIVCAIRLYDVIYESFGMHIPKFAVNNPAVRYPWFDRELHSLDYNKTKEHKIVKNYEKMNILLIFESVKGQYDANWRRFRDLHEKELNRLSVRHVSQG
jgi:hypothetical protein